MTSDLDAFLVAASPPPYPSPVMQWADVDRGNLDELPDRLCPKDNCPKCGSVWVEYSAVGFELPRPALGVVGGQFSRERFTVLPVYYATVPVCAVRLLCFDGHGVDFDGAKLRLVVPIWSALATGLLPMILGAYALRMLK